MSTELSVRQPTPARIQVGGTYEYMFNHDLIKIQIKKIIPEMDTAQGGQREAVVIFSKAAAKGLFEKEVQAIPLSTFRQCVLIGGLNEIDI